MPKKRRSPVDTEEPRSKTVLRERDVLRDYPFTSAWMRKSRKLIRGGAVNAGPAFVQAGRSIFYRRQAIEDWLHTHEIGGNGAATAK
jgi:hypothetical protein